MYGLKKKRRKWKEKERMEKGHKVRTNKKGGNSDSKTLKNKYFPEFF